MIVVMTTIHVINSLLLFLSTCHGYGILLCPISAKSHVMSLNVIGRELVRRGHQVHLLLDSSFKIPIEWEDDGIQYHRYGNKTGMVHDVESIHKNMTKELMEHDLGMDVMVTWIRNVNQIFEGELLLNNDDLIDSLKRFHLDIAIVDSISVIKYMYLIPHKLGIPWITYTDELNPWLVPTPWLPSIHSPIFNANAFQEGSFMYRLMNVIYMLVMSLNPISFDTPEEILDEYRRFGAFDNLDDLIRRSFMYFVTYDPAMEAVKPQTSNIIHVGGLTTELQSSPSSSSSSSPSSSPSPSPSPSSSSWMKYASFMRSPSNEGTVLVSFGSLVSTFTTHINKIFVETFTRLPQYRFIWKTENITCNFGLPSNVFVSDWLPQNQLLGRKEVVLFITHGGNNGQFEALYHGVPMLTIPLLGDQPHNARRVVRKGFGEMINFRDVTVEGMSTKIQQIIKNPRYKMNIMRASEIFKSQDMHASKRASFWIEHVLKFGASHLQPAGKELSTFQYLMLDVLLFVSFIVAMVMFIVVCLLRKLLDCLIVSLKGNSIDVVIVTKKNR